ncbi:DNA processing protein DprA [Thalassocella blandensis]|nr:DNA processing protein DprA [Thalassocella blandensis]
MNSHLLHTIILSSVSGIGPAAYWRLLEQLESLEAVYSQPVNILNAILTDVSTTELQQFSSKQWLNQKMERANRCLDWCAHHQVSVLCSRDEAYPALLKEINRPPPVLYVKGDVSNLSLPQIAVVGSRKPTPSGKTNASVFSQELALHGFAVTSGLALGVDAAAHVGALKANGKTIAVMGTGIDQVYPRRNAKLAEEILQNGGTLVSEFPLGTTPTPQNFPQRNRIVSGLSYGTLVVEAALKSGSLISAKFALEQNREVFAIPGAIQNPMSRGCHELIKQGATLVESASDIYQELQGFIAHSQQQLEMNVNTEQAPALSGIALSEMEQKVLEVVDFSPSDIDTLAQRIAISPGELMSCLISLELKNAVSQSGNGYIRAIE